MKKLEWRQIEDCLHLFATNKGTFGDHRSFCGHRRWQDSKPIDDDTLRECKTCDRLGGRRGREAR